MTFFKDAEEHSKVKTVIVAKYFAAWARIMSRRNIGDDKRFAYIDLFSGPGTYDDGTPSTPMRVVQHALKDERIRKNLVVVFNDHDRSYYESLQSSINEVLRSKSLEQDHIVMNREVDDALVHDLESVSLIPTLLFVDPWGYKGLSLRLLSSVVRNWGSDCIFFFNYNRINMGISNSFVSKHMDALFGEEEANSLRERLVGATADEREREIVEAILVALNTEGIRYVLLFRFRNSRGTRTTHHLIFGSKNPLGNKIMKEIMAGMSSSTSGGVASFEYNPAMRSQPALAGLASRLSELGGELLEAFAERTVTVGEVFDQHNVGTPYLPRNYKACLTDLEMKGQVSAEPPAEGRPIRNGRPTMADHVRITFPPRGAGNGR